MQRHAFESAYWAPIGRLVSDSSLVTFCPPVSGMTVQVVRPAIDMMARTVLVGLDFAVPQPVLSLRDKTPDATEWTYGELSGALLLMLTEGEALIWVSPRSEFARVVTTVPRQPVTHEFRVVEMFGREPWIVAVTEEELLVVNMSSGRLQQRKHIGQIDELWRPLSAGPDSMTFISRATLMKRSISLLLNSS